MIPFLQVRGMVPKRAMQGFADTLAQGLRCKGPIDRAWIQHSFRPTTAYRESDGPGCFRLVCFGWIYGQVGWPKAVSMDSMRWSFRLDRYYAGNDQYRGSLRRPTNNRARERNSDDTLSTLWYVSGF